MSHFLWVEDFAGNTSQSATESVFGELLNNQTIPNNERAVKKLLNKNGILVKDTFMGGLNFVRNPQRLLSVDYVILDIDLIIESDVDIDENNYLPQILKDYYGYEPQPTNKTADERSFDKAKGQLMPVAGYQLYIELVMALGFPRDHILFCSNHAYEHEELRAAFKKARIEFPQPFSKDEKAKVQAWVKKRVEEPYSVLRRGILNVLDDIEGNANIDLAEPFKRDVPVNKDTFLEGLRFMLNSPRIPSEDKRQHLYRTLCDYLTKYFDRFSGRDLYRGKYKKNGFEIGVPKEYSIPLYFVRNWVAHNILNNPKSEFLAPDVGFLFTLVIKGMFDYSSIEGFKLLYNYPVVNDSDLQTCLIDLQKRHYSYSGQCEIFELIRLKGERNWNRNLSTEDFVAQMYASFLFCCVELKARTKVKPFTDNMIKREGSGYWVNLTYRIDYQRDNLFEYLKSIAYHRLKERNF